MHCFAISSILIFILVHILRLLDSSSRVQFMQTTSSAHFDLSPSLPFLVLVLISCMRQERRKFKKDSPCVRGVGDFVGLVYFLLLINAQLARSHIDQQQQSTHNAENLEEIVFGEVFVGVMGVELSLC
jgi:hypothetical protein